MKRIILLFAAGLIIFACGGPATEDQAGELVSEIQIRELVSEPMQFEGQLVGFQGIIDHMCRHSGDKMRVAQTDDDAMSIQVRLGEMMGQFGREDEGGEVFVTGRLRTEVLNMEELLQHDEGHDCESTEEAVRLMAERGIDPNIRPYIELTGFEKTAFEE